LKIESRFPPPATFGAAAVAVTPVVPMAFPAVMKVRVIAIAWQTGAITSRAAMGSEKRE